MLDGFAGFLVRHLFWGFFLLPPEPANRMFSSIQPSGVSRLRWEGCHGAAL